MADTDKKTVKDLVNSQNANKPQTGTSPSSGLGVNIGGGYTPGSTLIPGTLQDTLRDNQARNNSNTDTAKRVGDWIYKGNGQWTPVMNSKTYVELNKNVVHGGYNKMQGIDFWDVSGAAGKALGSALLTSAQGAPLLAPFIGVASFIQGLTDANQKHADDFLNQQVDYESAVTYHTDDKGREYYTVDYDKVYDAGLGSGEIVKNAIDTTGTKAMITGDNSLSLKVSPAFAASERYSELLERIKDTFSNGLTVDAANSVADEETGKTYLDMINETVKQEESNFYYNAQTFHALKEVAPTASDGALKEAAATQLIGYLDSKYLSQSEVVVYDEQNTKMEVNAKEYLDSFKNKNEEERNSYMVSINNRIKSDDISDDEKAVLQAQSNALYAASKNDGEYNGMLMMDWVDEVAEMRIPFFDWRVGNILPFLGSEELTAFEHNPVIGPLLTFGQTAANYYVLGKVSNGIEGLMRNATVSLGTKIGGPLGGFLSGVNTFAKQDAPLPFSEVIKGNMGLGNWLKGTTTQMGFMLGADVAYEAGKAAAHGISNQDFDFWSELGQDVAMDAIMTYGPRSYLNAVNMPRLEYRRYDGDVTKKYDADKEILNKADEIYENNIKDLAEDEFDTDNLYPEGTGIRKYAGLVEVTADELAIRHAKRLDKLTDSKAVLKMQELFGDKNAAMAKLAIQVRAAGGSVKDYREALRLANDIKKVTEDTYMEFKQFGNVANDFSKMSDIINKLHPDKKDLTQDEANYINAAANRYRFLAENKGDKEAEAYINKFYNKYIEKIDPERAEELDELADAMRKVVANVLDFNKFKGLLSDADIKKLRNSPAYKNGMFLPVWSKGAGVNGKWANEIGQGRAGRKKVFNKDELIAVEDLEHPFVSVSQYINNNMRNIAINDKALNIIKNANTPGVSIHVYSDTGGSLSEVSNLKELSEEFGKRYENIVKKVKKEYPSHQQWVKINSDLIMNSQALQKAEELNTLKKQGDSLKRQLRKLEKAQEQSLADTPESAEVEELKKQLDDAKSSKKLAEMRKQLKEAQAEADKAFDAWMDANPTTEEEVAKLRARFDEAHNKCIDLREEIADAEDNISRLEAEYRDMNRRYGKPVDVDAIRDRLVKLRTRESELVAKVGGEKGDELTRTAEELEKIRDEIAGLEKELSDAVLSGNAKAELLPEVEDLDKILIKDPKVDAAIKTLHKNIKDVDDAVGVFGMNVYYDGSDRIARPRWYNDTMRVLSKNVLFDSFRKGTRRPLFDWDADRNAEHVVNDIFRRVDSVIKAELYANPQMNRVDQKLVTNETMKKYVEELNKVANDALRDIIKSVLTDDEVARLVKIANSERRRTRRQIIEERNEKLKNFEEAKPLIRNLGVSSYLRIHEGTLGDSYGYYAPNVRRSSRKFDYGFIDSAATGTVIRNFATDGSEIHVGLTKPFGGVYPGHDFQSTIIHEYAHAAFDRAVNRVPILTDLLGMLGIRADISERVANSRNATELVAYVTQKKFLDDIGAKDFSERFKDNTIVQRYLDAIIKDINENATSPDQRVSYGGFKQRFMKLLEAAVTFVKAKLLRLTDVNTFMEFYNGLTNGAFKDEMRISARNRPFSVEDTVTIPDLENGGWKEESTYSLDFHLDKIDVVALKMAEDIQTIKDQIDANGAEQARLTDEIKESARKLLEDAQKLAKGAPVELDINSFVNVELTNALKKAYKSNTAAGDIHDLINNAVELANPYVNRNTVIQTRAAEAAEKFRKRVAKHMAYKRNVEKGKKLSAEHINELADKVMDKISEKVIGKRNQVSAINDAELTRILNSGGDGHTIRYMLDGKEQRVVLTGKGSEELVKEFYAPEFTIKGPFKQRLLNVANKVANAKRYLTTSADISRVLPNLARDWSRGIVTTGGQILISPEDLKNDALEYWSGNEAATEKINNGFELVSAAIEGDTFTQSMLTAKKNRPKTMIRAMKSQDGNAFIRFAAKTTGEKLSMLQDMGEEFTRKRAMSNAYYSTLAEASANGAKVDDAIKQAVEAAYFYGREATTNFSRRGKLISQAAQMVPYLTQNFSSLESFKYAYLDNPIAVGRSLKVTVATYTALIALALSNEESRKKYFLLSEFDRSNNIIIPITNDMIMTIPLDENIAAFLTPYRRMIETLNGVDPEAFYLWGAEFLAALSPIDLTGFSEGDKFNIVRGFQKVGRQFIPTWAMPFIEAATGTDWYYGSNISVDEEYVGARTGNYTPTAGELTTKSANSKTLAAVANSTGIPQWILQRFVREYGGNVSQYVLNTIDKVSGASEDEQGGKEWRDSIFKPFTGADSDEASQAFWRGVNLIEERKKNLQNELRTLNGKIESTAGEEKANLVNQRREKIAKYGTDISDFLSQYLSAYELTGGLTKQQANRVWRLYYLYDRDDNQNLYAEGSVEEYFADKAGSSASKKATNLAGESGFDQYYHGNELTDYDTSYAMSALRNTVFGAPTQQMVDIANILEDTSDYDNSFTKMRSDVKAARKKLYEQKRWDERDKLAYQYDYKILAAIYPYLLQHGVAQTLNQSAVMDYLADWIIVPSEEMKTAKGRYVPSLGTDSQKEKAFKKQFIKKMYGVSGE